MRCYAILGYSIICYFPRKKFVPLASRGFHDNGALPQPAGTSPSPGKKFVPLASRGFHANGSLPQPAGTTPPPGKKFVPLAGTPPACPSCITRPSAHTQDIMPPAQPAGCRCRTPVLCSTWPEYGVRGVRVLRAYSAALPIWLTNCHTKCRCRPAEYARPLLNIYYYT